MYICYIHVDRPMPDWQLLHLFPILLPSIRKFVLFSLSELVLCWRIRALQTAGEACQHAVVVPVLSLPLLYEWIRPFHLVGIKLRVPSILRTTKWRERRLTKREQTSVAERPLLPRCVDMSPPPLCAQQQRKACRDFIMKWKYFHLFIFH